MRGSAMVVEASGAVQVRVPAEETVYDSFERPRYFSGIFACDASPGASALFRTSNDMTLAFRGEGQFSVERFEGLFGMTGEAGRGELEANRSRMILSLRQGELIIDSRSLTEDSRFVIETPVGRISSVKAVLMIRMEYDFRSNRYDFTVACREGTVRLRDRRRESYSIYAGQRIAGAGSYNAPSIEVGDQTEQIREKFETFAGTLDALDLDAAALAELRSRMQALPDHENETTTAFRLSQEQAREDRRRPRIIEFAPQTEYVTPFRGEVKPPSDFQAELF